MVVCCKCNRSGHCRNCACVKAGRLCQGCLPGRLKHCSNSSIEPLTSTQATTTQLPFSFSSSFQPAGSSNIDQSACLGVLSRTLPSGVSDYSPNPISTDSSPSHTITSSQADGVQLQPPVNSMTDNSLSITPSDSLSSSQTPPAVSWPLPPLEKASFVWGSMDGHTFKSKICEAYEEVIHWIPNLFIPPFGASGTKFVQELARMLQAYGDSSSLEGISMKGIAVLQHLLLQKPSKTSKAKDHARHLQRRLVLWLEGDLQLLLSECKCIQKRLKRNRPALKSRVADVFSKHMKQGNVRSAVNSLSLPKSKGVLSLDAEICVGSTKRSVLDILVEKFPLHHLRFCLVIRRLPHIQSSLTTLMLMLSVRLPSRLGGLLVCQVWMHMVGEGCAHNTSHLVICVLPLPPLVVDYAVPWSTLKDWKLLLRAG